MELLNAIKNESVEEVKSVLDRTAVDFNLYKLNAIVDKDGWYPLLEAVYHNNIKIIKLLIRYADKYNITLKLNKKENFGYYPLLLAIEKNNIEIIELLIKYAEENGITLELNEKDNDGWYPLYWATINNNLEIINLLIDYANKNRILLKVNEKNKKGKYPFLEALNSHNFEIVQLLINYAIDHNIVLEYDKNEIGNHSEIIELIKEYEVANEIKKDLFNAIEKENVKKVRSILNNVVKKKKNLNLNIVKDEKGWNPLLLAIEKKNKDIVQLLLEYSNAPNKTLDINEKVSIECGSGRLHVSFSLVGGHYEVQPLSLATSLDCVEIVELLKEYANQHNILL
eukprot:jgi/Orpsp1_1/1180673/evm.model.c7180000074290.1